VVNPDRSANAALRGKDTLKGRMVLLNGYGMVNVFRTVVTNGSAEHWATDNLEMSEQDRGELEQSGRGIEIHHRL